MGIKNLNKYLREKCTDSILCVHLQELANKKIAVDVSIYMYKYATEDVLIENMYLMLSIFRHYQIIPVFIFDGKPPKEKRELLKQRKDDKTAAELEYNTLLSTIDNVSVLEKPDVISAMDTLKKKFVNVDKDQIAEVKALIRAYGCTYYDAPGEADQLCAMLVIKNKVWACMSEDMDMFVYGTTRVLRYFSLMNHNVVIYEMAGILSTLSLSQNEFREICVLSGTDYNIASSVNKQSIELHESLRLFQNYRETCMNNTELTFYEWLDDKYRDEYDYNSLKKICAMFVLADDSSLTTFDNVKIVNSTVAMVNLMKILSKDGFVIPSGTGPGTKRIKN